ncbi:unnamed protein product [Coffea canephora]|uniref:Uncharacterized protein n=1 Tax=Coffea canephora TaxID=49390 RepID=A0A068V5E9_COFCA|nr:unnamed protein product [Coffea canephora]
MEERSRLEIQANKAASLHSDIMSIYYEKINAADDFEGRETALETKESQQIQQKLKAVKKEI